MYDMQGTRPLLANVFDLLFNLLLELCFLEVAAVQILTCQAIEGDQVLDQAHHLIRAWVLL